MFRIQHKVNAFVSPRPVDEKYFKIRDIYIYTLYSKTPLVYKHIKIFLWVNVTGIRVFFYLTVYHRKKDMCPL